MTTRSVPNNRRGSRHVSHDSRLFASRNAGCPRNVAIIGWLYFVVATISFHTPTAFAGEDVQQQLEVARKRFWSDSELDGDKRAGEGKPDGNKIPEIVGSWWNGVEGEGRQTMTIRQNEGAFTATCIYQHPKEGEIWWTLSGTITKERRISGRLVHTKAPKGWNNQQQIAVLSADAQTIKGRAIFDDGSGGHDFTWTRVKPNLAGDANRAKPADRNQDAKAAKDQPKKPVQGKGQIVPQDKIGILWKDAPQSIEVGDLLVWVTSARIGKVILERRNKDELTKDDYLVVTVGIHNFSETRKGDYTGWASRANPLTPATISDEFGNVYKRIVSDAVVNVKWQLTDGVSLYPATTIMDVLVFEPPIRNAKELRCSLPGEAIGVRGTLKIKIPISGPKGDGTIFDLSEELRAKRLADKKADDAARAAEKRRILAEELAKDGPGREERAAESKLRTADQLLKVGKPEAYRAMLKELIERYPNSKAAETAKKALK
ncbi:MAG: hypothetical protein HY290_03455 [Planctomycetia bacterium]|nr:hypothetical protein [Planctomycetia bacterium]